mmetsp:Transcript_1510/g.3588  ORF Transcript_1510/g.3588 Transcript_1510/m.3588 type:complete len:206 (+) Transcript_1510:351-968(+)
MLLKLRCSPKLATPMTRMRIGASKVRYGSWRPFSAPETRHWKPKLQRPRKKQQWRQQPKRPKCLPLGFRLPQKTQRQTLLARAKPTQVRVDGRPERHLRWLAALRRLSQRPLQQNYQPRCPTAKAPPREPAKALQRLARLQARARRRLLAKAEKAHPKLQARLRRVARGSLQSEARAQVLALVPQMAVLLCRKGRQRLLHHPASW